MSAVSDQRRLIAAELAEVHHCLPGKIVDWDGTSATVRPVLDKQLANGEKLTAPQIVRVPVKWMCGDVNGAQALFTVPLKPGDDVVLTFCDRALEEWLQGVDGVPSDPRQFDISDAFCTPVLRPSAGLAADTENVSLQFAQASLKIMPDGSIVITSPIGIVLATPLVTITGALTMANAGLATVTGNIAVTGDVTAGTISLRGHHHQEHDGPSTGPAQP